MENGKTNTKPAYLNFLDDSVCQGVNRFFVLSFGNFAHRISRKRYFPHTV